jgi:hypothetical protein
LPTIPDVILSHPDELTAFVHRSLCALDRLDPVQCPVTSLPVLRKGRPCGSTFQVIGPRQLRTSAIYSADDGRLLLYDSTGTRVQEYRIRIDTPSRMAA